MVVAAFARAEELAGGKASHRTCGNGHVLESIRVRPGDRGCDHCGGEIQEEVAYHCESCDFDLCGACHGAAYSPARPPPAAWSMTARLGLDDDEAGSSPRARLSQVLKDLGRLSMEYTELEAVEDEEEQAACGEAAALRDAQQLRLELLGTLKRYRQRRPSIEELLQRYEAEIEALTSEAGQLHDERAALALAGDVPVAETASSSPRRLAAAEAAQRLREEVRENWRCQAAAARRWRRARADEWRLGSLRSEMQGATRAARSRERCLAETRRQCSQAKEVLRELAEEREVGQEEIERERRSLAALHRDALALRQACLVPAQLKCKGAALVRALDQEGGRLATQRRVSGLQVASKLHRAVSAHAPALQPLAGRAVAAMEEEFARYQRLQQSHAQMLQRAHLAVMRGALSSS